MPNITGLKTHKTINKHSGARNFNSSEFVTNTPQGLANDYVIHGTCRDAILGIKLNSDATSNYRQYNMQGLVSTASASVNDTTTITQAFGSTTSGKPSAFRLIITGDSDTEKYINSFVSLNSAINVQAIYWKNNTSDLSSISIFDSVSRTVNADIWVEQVPKQANLDNYDLMEVVEFTNRSTDIVFSGLDGDSDEEYLIEWNADSAVNYYFNADNGTANYQKQRLYNNSGTITAVNGNGQPATYKQSFTSINAVSGRKRLTKTSASQVGLAIDQSEEAIWWSNTVDNITSITATGLSSTTGTVKLYRRKSNRTIDLVTMRTVVDKPILGDYSSGATISNIQGNRIEGAIKVEYTGVGNADIEIQFNTITSNTNQQLKASSSTVSAASTSPTKIKLCGGSSDTTNTNKGVLWIYPKSGQNRPCLNEQSYNANTLEKNAIWINDDTNEIASFTINATNTNTMDGELLVSVPKGTKQAANSFTYTLN